MPLPLTDYEVPAPDGTLVKFRGPSNMTDDAVRLRANQEHAIQTGAIPTTFTQGAAGSIADQSKDVGAVVGLAGAALGQPEVVAAAPLIGRGVKAAAEYVAGRPVTPTDAGELAGLGAEGAVAGYGPQLAGKALTGLSESTVAHQLANGKWVKGVTGHGFWPWAIRTGGEMAGSVAPIVKAPATKVGFAAALSAAQAAMDQGVPPSKAALEASQGDPSVFGQIMATVMKSRTVK